MNQSKHLYETTYIVNASLEDTQIETARTHIEEIITRNGGEIKAVNKWGRKRLAYTIEKKNNGFYINTEFEGPGSIVSLLERAYTLDENILRFLTIQLDKKAIKARQMPQPAPASTETEPVIIKEPAAIGKAPLFNDDIEEPEASSSPIG